MDSIILVGPMGSGKSEVGRIVAYRAGLPFVDADTEFVSRYGGITEFVGKNGWPEFRRLEAQTLEGICHAHSDSRIVLATGGGAVAHDQGEEYRQRNVSLLRGFGSVLYLLPSADLKISAQILAARVLHDKASSASMRPSLKPFSNPLASLLAQLRDRDGFYRSAADYVILTGTKSPDEVADIVSAKIRDQLTPAPMQPLPF